jgi:hypothetical protein
VVAGSALMGVAGAFLTLAAFNAFFFNMVNGRGWICVALVVFASWRPGKALLGALLFAFFDALQLRLQQSGDSPAALPGLPDAALCPVHPGPGAGGPPCALPSGPDEALPQGRALRLRPLPPLRTADARAATCPTAPMLDLLITHATLADGRTRMAVAVQDGRITEVTEGLQAPRPKQWMRAACCCPPFVDPTSTWTPR